LWATEDAKNDEIEDETVDAPTRKPSLRKRKNQKKTPRSWP